MDSLVFADVDSRGLTQVEFIVGGLFHQVEDRVFQDELHELNEWLLHVHALAEQFFAVDARHVLNLLLVGFTWLVEMYNILTDITL